MEKDLNRRDFLSKGTASVATLSALSVMARPERVLGANNRVRVAICGVHSRGNNHLENYAKASNVQIAALCDIDESVLSKRVAQMEKMGFPNRPPIPTYASCWRINPSTRYPLPHRIIGTR